MILMYHLQKLVRTSQQVTFLLSGNIYLLILLSMVVLLSFNIKTLIDGFGVDRQNLLQCKIQTYVIHVVICSLYHTFLMQVSKELEWN